MYRQYHSYWQRFDQPDPYDGSYNLTDPQSLNRYSYVQNDPVNFVDPSGLNMQGPGSGQKCAILDDGELFCWYPEDVVVVDTWAWPSLLNPFFTGADIGFGSGDTGRRGAPRIDDLGGGGPSQSPTVPQRTVPSPNQPPPCNETGSGDIGVSATALVGPVLGVQYDARGVYGYTGVAVGFPPTSAGGQMTGGPDPVDPGLNLQISGGLIIGGSRSILVSPSDFQSVRGTVNAFKRLYREGSNQVGGFTPGLELSLVRVSREPLFRWKNCR